MPARYAPELIAHVRHRYEHTDDTLAKIATDCGISERTVNRMRDRGTWTRRSDRPPRGLPPALRTLQEATALLTAAPASCAPLASPAGGGEQNAAAPSAIERIERLVEKELSAEEAVRAQLGPLPRLPADAERAARTLATLTQTLQALARLRCGLPPDGGPDDDDDMPRDIDEFRRELARRIDAFVASRTEPRHAQGHSGPAKVDEAR
jgi:hypothetical protein